MKRSILLILLVLLAISCDDNIDGPVCEEYHRIQVTPNRVETDATESYLGSFVYFDPIYIQTIWGCNQKNEYHMLAKNQGIKESEYHAISPENPHVLECEGIISVRQTSPFDCTVSIEANGLYKAFDIVAHAWDTTPGVYYEVDRIYIYRNAGE